MQIKPRILHWIGTLAVSALGFAALHVIFKVIGPSVEQSVVNGALQGLGGYVVTTCLAAWGRKRPNSNAQDQVGKP